MSLMNSLYHGYKQLHENNAMQLPFSGRNDNVSKSFISTAILIYIIKSCDVECIRFPIGIDKRRSSSLILKTY